MMISRALVALTLFAGCAASAVAAPIPRPMGMAPGFAPWHGGDHGFHGGWDHRHGGFPGLAIGAFGPVYDTSGGYTEAPPTSIWIAPIALTITTNAAASPSSSEGPRLIVIGRRVPPRHPLPLVIYGDPGA
jgi:hypothetical protein